MLRSPLLSQPRPEWFGLERSRKEPKSTTLKGQLFSEHHPVQPFRMTETQTH